MVGALDFDEKADQRVITNLAQNLLSVSSLSLHFACKTAIFGVEPRGVEPLTSAVQSQGTTVVLVRHCSEIPAK
jgi:hypothetical protein